MSYRLYPAVRGPSKNVYSKPKRTFNWAKSHSQIMWKHLHSFCCIKLRWAALRRFITPIRVLSKFYAAKKIARVVFLPKLVPTLSFLAVFSIFYIMSTYFPDSTDRPTTAFMTRRYPGSNWALFGSIAQNQWKDIHHYDAMHYYPVFHLLTKIVAMHSQVNCSAENDSIRNKCETVYLLQEENTEWYQDFHAVATFKWSEPESGHLYLSLENVDFHQPIETYWDIIHVGP